MLGGILAEGIFSVPFNIEQGQIQQGQTMVIIYIN